MGVLSGIKVIELQGIGPAPMCCMMLSDMGAEVIRIDRVKPGVPPVAAPETDVMARGRKSVAVDLKQAAGVEVILRLLASADVLVEGFRPGVMERLGLGPEVCLERNPKLVYGRMTGWGQDGPIAHTAGHDINYIALAGVLFPIGERGGKPIPPLNLVGDFGGGGMLLAMGVLAALLEASRSRKGQVVDAAMFEGAAQLGAFLWGLRAQGRWQNERGVNLLDTGAHFYNTYETKDGKHVAIGSIEPQFYRELLALSGLEGDTPQMDAANWPAMTEKLATIVRTKTAAEWDAIMGDSDVCFAPVLDLDEAPRHRQAVARRSFVTVGEVVQPAPAPRFSRTPSQVQGPPALAGAHTRASLLAHGFDAAEVEGLLAQKVVSQREVVQRAEG